MSEKKKNAKNNACELSFVTTFWADAASRVSSNLSLFRGISSMIMVESDISRDKSEDSEETTENDSEPQDFGWRQARWLLKLEAATPLATWCVNTSLIAVSCFVFSHTSSPILNLAH